MPPHTGQIRRASFKPHFRFHFPSELYTHWTYTYARIHGRARIVEWGNHATHWQRITHEACARLYYITIAGVHERATAAKKRLVEDCTAHGDKRQRSHSSQSWSGSSLFCYSIIFLLIFLDWRRVELRSADKLHASVRKCRERWKFCFVFWKCLRLGR